MTMKIKDRPVSLVLAVALALGTASAGAGTVTVPNGGSLYLSESTTGSGSSPFGALSAVSIPGNYTYQDAFSAPQTTHVAGTSAGFYDDFVFSIGAGQVDSVTSSVSLGGMLGISNMKVTLYDYAANGDVKPLLTTPAPGSVYAPWSSSVSFQGGVASFSVLSPTTLTAGTYVIEVQGTASGTSGGNYTGSLNVTPVPLPGGLAAALGGMGLLTPFARRRRAG